MNFILVTDIVHIESDAYEPTVHKHRWAQNTDSLSSLYLCLTVPPPPLRGDTALLGERPPAPTLVADDEAGCKFQKFIYLSRY